MSESQSPNPAATTPAKRPILIVDDEPEMLYSLRNLLRREFDVHTARSGEEGINILQEHEIHLVMTDQRMPHMTGVELLHRMKSEHPAAMRLIFTGYADIKTVIDAINQGHVYRYITKPWDPEELVQSLREAGERYDQIVDRNRLLKEIRFYENQCIGYADALLSGNYGNLSDEGVKEGKRLLDIVRGLVKRLDHALDLTLREPMC